MKGEREMIKKLEMKTPMEVLKNNISILIVKEEKMGGKIILEQLSRFSSVQRMEILERENK